MTHTRPNNICVHLFLFCAHAADQDEERLQRRTMVKLGVRVIHKITSEARCTELPPSTNSAPMMPRTLRLRLSPKALKLASKFSPVTNVAGTTTTTTSTVAAAADIEENKGSMSRIDVEKGSYHRNSDTKVSENILCVAVLFVAP